MDLELEPLAGGIADFDAVDDSTGNSYKGPERRRGPRRVSVDRRDMLRFNPKPDRRCGDDRRADCQTWNHYSTI